MHGHINSVLLISTLVPIIKEKLGNICSSENYRSIAISSLILKIFDWVMILIYGDKLCLDQLQFSYQQKVSTNMCTWMAIETIDLFTRNGSSVFVCAMDMSKAFDRVKHSLLFKKLIIKGVPIVYVRLLIVIYRRQSANVRWNDDTSYIFPLSNGVKQGAVLSAILFCVYVNDLYILLRKRGCGCTINSDYYGIIGYSDDLLLLAPSIDALQDMLHTCEEYASEHNLTFSTNENVNKSKTKCIIFGESKSKDLRCMKLCGDILPWVKRIKHLGSDITNEVCSVKEDIMQKRASYISRNNELYQEFAFAHPISRIIINNLFNTSFYGCVLWDLFGTESLRLEKTWNTSIRKLAGLPRETHRFFIEPISQTKHIVFALYGRFCNFVGKIRESNKSALTNLLRAIQEDCRSRTGSNLRKILVRTTKSNVEDLDARDITEKYQPIPIGSHWKIEMVRECIDCRSGNLTVPGFNRNEIDEIKNLICAC